MGEARRVLEQAIERWNAVDRDGWAALYTDDVVYEAPGGARISGPGRPARPILRCVSNGGP